MKVISSNRSLQTLWFWLLIATYPVAFYVLLQSGLEETFQRLYKHLLACSEQLDSLQVCLKTQQ